MEFPEFLKECANNSELVTEFNRLNRCNLYHLDLDNPRDVEILDQFTAFVYNYIWLPVLNS
ncbi:hypothetical protein NG799_02115 [Laspinema sp. D1]|uniref:Uncharacterized protein n=1 Tax=Laspinema palackyanum D2a TaxID=2953684 RepID=A0ABT2MK87_9CYAN|nr:hypothetical protein [Laspinema sp. D2a]